MIKKLWFWRFQTVRSWLQNVEMASLFSSCSFLTFNLFLSKTVYQTHWTMRQCVGPPGEITLPALPQTLPQMDRKLIWVLFSVALVRGRLEGRPSSHVNADGKTQKWLPGIVITAFQARTAVNKNTLFTFEHRPPPRPKDNLLRYAVFSHSITYISRTGLWVPFPEITFFLLMIA